MTTTRTIVDVYDELVRNAVEARAKASALLVLSLDLRDLDQMAAARVASSWASRQEAYAEECEALRDLIEQTAREVSSASA